MSGSEVLVVLGGVAAILWVNWYFLLAGRGSARAALAGAGVQEVRIRVRGGYDPAHVELRRGVPARLVFEREEASGCSEEVVLPDFGIRRFLPPHQRTTIELLPERSGTYGFTCGMGMLRGSLTVRDEGGAS